MTATDSSPAEHGRQGPGERDPSSGSAVVVQGVTKRYGRTLALDDVSLEIAHGQRYAILGPNGAGKTTLIHILCTINAADTGTVLINGFDVNLRPKQVREQLGVVFQEASLDTRLTVEENLRFHGRIFGVPERLVEKRMSELLALVDLERWANHLVGSLSKGMQRRLEIARSLIHDARLMVLDEPTVGLDAQTRLNMWDYLSRLQTERDLTLLVTTHYIEEVEGCDEVCIIDHGKVLTIGAPDRIRREHGRTAVRMTARDSASAETIATQVPGAQLRGDEVEVPVADDEDVERLLSAHAASLREFTVERATLETAFLNLTGRGLRDPAASGGKGATSKVDDRSGTQR